MTKLQKETKDVPKEISKFLTTCWVGEDTLWMVESKQEKYNKEHKKKINRHKISNSIWKKDWPLRNLIYAKI